MLRTMVVCLVPGVLHLYEASQATHAATRYGCSGCKKHAPLTAGNMEKNGGLGAATL